MKTNTLESISLAPYEVEKYFDPLLVRRTKEIALHGLSEVVIEGNFIMASADRLFRHPFGRDSAISADKLLRYNPEIARQSILLMVALQGVTSDRDTEEEPGKIFHEMKIRGTHPEQQAVFDKVSRLLGIGDGEKFVSYTSIDATLEFIHLVAHHTQLYGRDFLAATVRRRDGTVTIEQGLRDAVGWLKANMARSDSGLIGAHRTNPRGVVVPDLLDGATSFLHSGDGALINYENEMNTINFQSLGYQALVEAAGTLVDAELLDAAEELAGRTLEHFWLPDTKRVVMAVDRDARGQHRRLGTHSILPAVALRTGIFDAHPEIVEATLKGLYTPEMMTCVGPRTQTLAMNVGYTRYQEPPWPVLIGRVIEGAIRYEQYAIAADLSERLMAGASATGQAQEFHQVTYGNKLGLYTADPTQAALVVTATNIPEAPQAWTAATLWQLTSEIIPLLEERRDVVSEVDITVDLSLNKKLETTYYTLDQAKAWELERAILKQKRAV